MTTPTRPDRRLDPVLAALHAHPVKIHRPDAQRVPFVFSSPHSGRLYPECFVEQSRLDPLTLRRSEDAFVDSLFGGIVAFGAPMIAARFPRAYLDVNRGASELDPGMFEGRLDVPVDSANARVHAGLGVIPRIVRDGAEIYGEKISPAQARERIARLYRPYHEALARLIEETRRQFGVAILIDCHSMPSAVSVPDVVLGNRFGASACASLTNLAETSLRDVGFSVARNAPYAGGYTTLLHGQRDSAVHALQIELNRSLYLDEERIELKADFGAIQSRLTEALARLVKVDIAALGSAQQTLAAE